MDKTERFFYLPQATNASFIFSLPDGSSCTPEPLESELEGPTESAGNYPCPCHECPTFPVPKEEAIAYICPACSWESDVFDPDGDAPGSENRGATPWQGRENYRKWGVVWEDLARRVRLSRPGEQPL